MRQRQTTTLMFSIALLLTACVAKVTEIPNIKYWPEPPEIPRFMHEFTLREARDIRDPQLARQASLVEKLSGQTTEPRPPWIGDGSRRADLCL